MADVAHQKKCLPFGWKVLVSSTYPDRVYYFNENTGVSTWECPTLHPAEKGKNSNCKTFEERPASPPKPQTAAKKRKRKKKCKVPPNEVKIVNNSFPKQNLPSSPNNTLKAGGGASSKSLMELMKHSKTAIVCPVVNNNKSSSLQNSRKMINKISEANVSSSDCSAMPAKKLKHDTAEASKPSIDYSEIHSVRQPVKFCFKGANSCVSQSKAEISKKPVIYEKNSDKITKMTQAVSCFNSEMKKLRKKLKLKQTLAKKNCKVNGSQPLNIEKPEKKSSIIITSKAANRKRKKNSVTFQETQIDDSKRKNNVMNNMGSSVIKNTEAANSDDSNQFDVEMLDMSVELTSLDNLNETMQIENSTYPESFVLVVDTNILMEDLQLIDELKDTPIQGCGPSHLFIPWVVFKELDGLKRTKEKQKQLKAVDAGKYVYSMLHTQHPRFHGQTAKMAKQMEVGLDQCNDDKILGCCIQLQKKMSKEKVILLTNDRNLSSKALIHNVDVHSIDSFLRNKKSDVEIVHEKNLSSDDINYYTQTGKLPEKDVKTKMDSIICETKLLLKSILEPMLQKILLDAYGDHWKNIFDGPPWSLTDILKIYSSHWNTVFIFVLPPDLQVHFNKLKNLFDISKGFVGDSENVSAVLASIEVICDTLMGCFPSIQPIVERIANLCNQCKILCKRGEEIIDDEHFRKNSVGSSNVLTVFSNIWDLTNFLCGMIMDFSGIPHSFVYQKPEKVPSQVEFALLISNLYPSVSQIKQALGGVLDLTSSSAEKEKYIMMLFNLLVQFVPSLQIQTVTPPLENFTIANLKSFCFDENYREILQNGFTQWLGFLSKLNEVIHNWKK